MQVDLFDFDLPEKQIALRPAVPRESARLLHVLNNGKLEDLHVADLPSLFKKGDALVFNDTKVIKAQLQGCRYRDGAVAHIGATLHKRVSPNQWKAFVRPAKRLKIGETIVFSGADKTIASENPLNAIVCEKGENGEMLLEFDKTGAELDRDIALIGHMPLPPYIALKRGEDKRDEIDYQTIYAREEGAVAAPTAGLHFTREMMQQLKDQGVEQHFVTLHVGAGTFLPVKVDDTKDHKMHSETGHIDKQTADALMAVKHRGNRVIAVGTTAMRVLESAADDQGNLQPWSGSTDIFITPGYHFRFVDCLMTNFHLPRSTLFMLVSAFSGLDTMRHAYRHAIDNNYRFYSYGDTSFLERKDQAL
ncbi:tRNA preQ1(34) S-adenosylmethionine ribosyltransferase-isomerase QueA [uncultured Bartonella sp.]|uniref:tRNA preQ1(34) S-adenosylmethionine ribosyltransferase-isomerase QueA n=1 Tax=uncultured Bartonella sp. TaxID=104108 RepID=UPI002626EF0C|nr:tRNA preQ1(34) S-adenosylmethionine ribosyltransferase-isomerase QueA [uncultured Bartonella sp.]